ncbi:MAG TPA: C69 family dipeptidase [Bacteroidales bacterium]|nr:C69 family dipeptidase [Bacteroidales bacterium]
MKRLIFSLMLTAGFILSGSLTADACTNFLVTKGASTDGSTMISYAADSHLLYGELYFRPAKDHPKGSMVQVYEWDTGKYLGEIPQVKHTYRVVGNVNEHQLAIGETTYGGRSELRDSTGIIDYGSLIYLTLQRAKNAREAIKVMSELVENYGYYSSGESFSIADENEVWIMELIGNGPGKKGAVWVARMVPDGYVCAHANQARITTFPKVKKNKWFDKDQTTFHSEDVVDFAREKGWFDGKDKDFSFSDTYAPVDFGGARFCEMRVWAFFDDIASGMDQYWEYAKGNIEHGEHDYATNRMPLWIKPDEKVDVHTVMDNMRNHLEGTELDMSKDVGAGPFGNPYRWRPLTWEVDGKTYCNERATATQQTGFSFVAQLKSWMPDPVGGVNWFSVDDADFTVYVPIFCGITDVPESYAVGNGDIMDFEWDAAFWVFNMVSNFAYTRYNLMHPEIREVQLELEKRYIQEVKAMEDDMKKLYKSNPEKAIAEATDYSVKTANQTVDRWQELYAYLFTKYMDGNVKAKSDPKEGYKYVVPQLEQPGYGEDWYRRIIEETDDQFLMPGSAH